MSGSWQMSVAAFTGGRRKRPLVRLGSGTNGAGGPGCVLFGAGLFRTGPDCRAPGRRGCEDAGAGAGPPALGFAGLLRAGGGGGPAAPEGAAAAAGPRP